MCVNEVIQMQVGLMLKQKRKKKKKRKEKKRVTRAKDPVQVCVEDALPDQWPEAR